MFHFLSFLRFFERGNFKTENEIFLKVRNLNFYFSLKRLSAALLMRLIQEGNQGHSSVEDAIATMQLFQIVQSDFEKRCPDLAGANLLDDQFWDQEDQVETYVEDFSEDYI